MYNITRRFSTKIKPIPMPKVQSTGIKGRLFKHFQDVKDYMDKNNVNIMYTFNHITPELYKSTNSKTVMLDFVSTKLVLTSDPKVYKEIFGPKQDSFTNSTLFKKVFGYFFPENVIVVDGKQWLKIRKIMQRAISKTSMDPVVYIISDTISDVFQKPLVNKIDTYDIFSRITFDTFHKLMYNWDPKSVHFSPESSEILNACNTIGHAMGKRFLLPYKFLWNIPTSENRNVDKAIKFVRNFVIDFVKKHKDELKANLEKPGYKKTLLDEMLIASESSEDGALTVNELNDNIGGLFFAAYDTTSNTLMHLFNFLAKYPEEQEKLRNAIKHNFITYQDLRNSKATSFENISTLNNFIDEVNRITPFIPWVDRDCIKDTIIGDYEIKKGYLLNINTREIGRNPEFWNGMTDLDSFRPDRWSEHRPAILESVLPFGFGGRICPGRKLAILEMKLILCAVLYNHKVEFRNGDDTKIDSYIGISVVPGTGNIKFSKL